MFPATLFDYNGVLVDDEHVHLAAFRVVLGRLGVTLDEAAYFERYLGFDDVGAFRAVLTDAGRAPSEAQVRELVQRKRPEYLALARHGLETFAGAADLLRRRANAGPVVIVSGALRDEIVLGLDVLGVANEVAAIVSAEDTRACKPDPEGYRLGIEALERHCGGVDARHALVFEDSIAGIEAATAAGLTTVAVAHSYPEAQLQSAKPALVRRHIADVTDDDLRALWARLHG